MYKISVVIPAYNEGEKIGDVLERLKAVLGNESVSYEIVVINDGSADDTEERARAFGASIITHNKKEGYGKSLKDGIRASQGELILLIDADDTYDISAIPKMLSLIKKADLVVGKRIFSKKSKDSFKNITRRFFAYLVSYYSTKRIEDLNSGLRIFRRCDVIDRLDAFPDGFSFTSTMTVLYTVEGKNILYTPAKYEHREKGSKFVSFQNIRGIAKLAFSLTMRGRPFLLSAQLTALFIITVFLSKSIRVQLHAGFPVQIVFFAIIALFLFLSFLCYIYVRGRGIVSRNIT